ncbi:MAG TPA: phage terminase large subunit [Anaeromyxobacteraceae bacterium]|nr:phage terminase large subunit [Anaeromyxobacteraceae bacterium]
MLPAVVRPELLWRATPATLAQRLSRGRWIPARHLLFIAQVLVALLVGRHKRVILSVPPRHGKSELASHWLPVWALELWPWMRIILTSYEARFASRWGRTVRDTIQTNGRELNVRVSRKSSAANQWDTTAGGGMLTAGVGGPITGWGANLFLIDDPFKNADQANSQLYRDKVWEWWQSTAYTRIEPFRDGREGVALLTMARWHEDDLAGRLERFGDEGGEPWHVIRLPALADDVDDPLGRRIGEALWPERRSEEQLLNIKTAIGSYYFDALFQERPAPESGDIFKRDAWRFYSKLPDLFRFELFVVSWDMSFDDKGKDPSYVVGQVWGKLGGDFYLVDQVRAQLNFPATKLTVRTFSAKHPYAALKLVEDKANGPAIIAELARSVPGLVPVNPMGDKVARARAVSPLQESGNIFLPSPELAPWIHDFVAEAAAFPNGQHDDQVDSMTQALIRLNGVPVADPDAYADSRR